MVVGTASKAAFGFRVPVLQAGRDAYVSGLCPVRFRGCVNLAISHRNKAVAIGAVSHYVDHFVTSRISKFTYGVACNTAYDPSNAEHRKRSHNTFVNSMGEKRIRGGFATMLTRVRHARFLSDVPGFNLISAGHQSHRGTRDPTWLLPNGRGQPAATSQSGYLQIHRGFILTRMGGRRAR